MHSKAHALKKKISNFMPSRKSVVDNRANPDSAHSKVMRATAAKGPTPKFRTSSPLESTSAVKRALFNRTK